MLISSLRRSGLRLVALAGALALGVVLTSTPNATSKSPHQVDPATLQPTLNPDFAPWSCFRAGQGITCQGSYQDSWSEPIGLACGGREVWITGHAHEFMTRWHTADGLATKTVVHLDYPEDVFSFDPAGPVGQVLVVSGHWNRHYDYPNPGDVSTRTLTERGQIYLGKAGGRVVLRDVGSVAFKPGEDYEGILQMHGVHDIYAGTVDFEQLLCESLS
jgi:hypothetical protein